MKTIGIIGGITYQSTLEYYKIINDEINKRKGSLHSAKIILYSLDFENTVKYLNDNNWEGLTEQLIDAGQRVKSGGADFIIIACNTAHKVIDEVQKAVNLPLLNIIDLTGEKIKEKNLKKIGLLGSKFTMMDGFYKDRLENKHGLEVITPKENDINLIHDIVLKELPFGKINNQSRKNVVEIINRLEVEGVILGCTELPSLIKQSDIIIPIFNATKIHVEAAVNYALKK